MPYHQHRAQYDETNRFDNSGGASAAKEPGHFEVRKSSSQVTRMHFFPQKSWQPFFSYRPQNTGGQRRFTVNKAVRYGNIFIFCSHYYRRKAIRRVRQGEAKAWARAVDLPARSFDLARPGVEPPLVDIILTAVLVCRKLLQSSQQLFRNLRTPGLECPPRRPCRLRQTSPVHLLSPEPLQVPCFPLNTTVTRLELQLRFKIRSFRRRIFRGNELHWYWW